MMEAYPLLICLILGILVLIPLIMRERKRRTAVSRELTANLRDCSSSSASGMSKHNEDLVQELFAKVKEYGDFLFRFTPTEPIEVKAVSAGKLQQLSQDGFGKRNNFCGLCMVEDGKIMIYVQNNLPINDLFATIAHEYAHAWQRHEGFAGGAGEREEGFAEWVAWHMTEVAGYDPPNVFNKPSTTVYANGLRKFKIIEERFGFHGAVKAGKSSLVNLKVLR